MAGKESMQGFNDTMKLTEEAVKTLEKLMDQIVKSLSAAYKSESALRLAAYIKEGNLPLRYEVQGDQIGSTVDDLCERLEEEEVPFVRIAGSANAILIRPEDLEMVKEKNHDMLIEAGNYFQAYDLKEMEDKIARAPENIIKEKDVLELHGLTQEECEEIRNKCNNITRGFMVGIEREKDGTYNIAVSTNKNRIYSKGTNKYSRDFCRAYLEAELSLYGHNREIKRSQVEYDIKFRERLKDLSEKNQDRTYYVAGANDRRKYIEITPDGFALHQFKTFTNKDGKMKMAEMVDYKHKCLRTDPDFEIELMKATDMIKDKVIVEDPGLLRRHMEAANGEHVLPNERPARSKVEIKYAKSEKMMAEAVDKAIREKIEKDGTTFKDEAEAFKYYKHQAARIIDCVMKGQEIPDYPEATSLDIMEAYHENGIKPVYEAVGQSEGEGHEAEFTGYKETAQRIETADVEIHRARTVEREQERPAQEKNRDGGKSRQQKGREDDDPHGAR